jgi:hypothetical protein
LFRGIHAPGLPAKPQCGVSPAGYWFYRHNRQRLKGLIYKQSHWRPVTPAVAREKWGKSGANVTIEICPPKWDVVRT